MQTTVVKYWNPRTNRHENRDAEVHGHVVAFKGWTGYWVARNTLNGRSTNNAEKQVAIGEVK